MVKRLVIEEAETGILTIHGSEFAIRFGADLDTSDVAEIIRLSTEFRRFGSKPEKLAEWADRARALIFKMIEREEPDPDELARAKNRALAPTAAMQILTFLLDNPAGPEAAVAEALTDGLPAEEVAGQGDPPTSQKRSRSRRSRSARSSTSPRPTGEDSDGETSSSTSPTRTAAAA